MSLDFPARTAFGKLLKRLRGMETQIDFARKLGIFSRSTYSMIERGHRRPQAPHRDHLIRLYPKQQAEIEARFTDVDDEEASRNRRPSNRRVTRTQRVILGMIKVGRGKEARASITRALSAEEDPPTRIWLLEQLAEVEHHDANPEAAVDLSREAIDVAHASGLHDEERRLRRTLARRLARRDDFAAAHAVVDEGLMYHPDAADLWHRKGILHWYAHEYGDAVACLVSARANGIPKRKFLYARGSVLAEWGHFAGAIEDLSLAIEDPVTPANQAYARSTRAYAIANSGDMERALSEWELAEQVIPESGWLHYFRALSYGRFGDTDRMLAGLQRALACEVPAMNSKKRAHAIKILSEHGIDAES